MVPLGSTNEKGMDTFSDQGLSRLGLGSQKVQHLYIMLLHSLFCSVVCG